MHDSEDRSFIGHPRGLGYIAFTEAWERFSYYGMQALLVLYMVNRLLHPGHIEHIAGFGPFRHLIEIFRGPLSIQALASTIFGLYTGLVYLTPIVGGLIADRVLGRTRTITIGALLMSAGHFLMAFDVTFPLALTCLLTGVGCFKGNLASQVGALYATGDNRRADALHVLNSIGFANIFPVSLALYARAWRQPHCPPLSSASITWRSSLRTISSAQSAVFWKKCRQHISGFCIRRYAARQALSSYSPATSSATCWRPAVTKANCSNWLSSKSDVGY